MAAAVCQLTAAGPATRCRRSRPPAAVPRPRRPDPPALEYMPQQRPGGEWSADAGADEPMEMISQEEDAAEEDEDEENAEVGDGEDSEASQSARPARAAAAAGLASRPQLQPFGADAAAAVAKAAGQLDNGDSIVPSTPTLMEPRRGDAFAESVPSSQPIGGDAGVGSVTSSGSQQVTLAAAAGLDDNRRNIIQLNSRGTEQNPLQTSGFHDDLYHMIMGCRQSKDSKDGKSIYEKETLAEHEGAINCMGLSEDGSLLVTGSDDWTARMWSTQTDDTECLGVLEGHENSVTCVALSDTYVLTGSSDKTIRKWDMTRCECLYIYEGHTSRINRLICTGEFIFSASSDQTSRAWIYDTEVLENNTGANACIKVFKGHRHGIYSLIFLSGKMDSGSDTDEDDSTVTVHPADLLITGSMDNTAKSWSVDTAKCLRTFRGHMGAIVCMTTDDDGENLFTAGEDRTIKIWEILTGILIKTMEGHTAPILCMQVVKKLLYTGSKDKTARCWVTAFGENTRTYQKSQHSVNSLKVANGVVFTGSGDTNARAYDAKSGALKRTYAGHSSAISCLQWINHKLYTGANDGVLKVWDARDIADDPAPDVSDSDSEDDEERQESNKENNVRLKELERRLEYVSPKEDQQIKQMEDVMAGIQDYD